MFSYSFYGIAQKTVLLLQLHLMLFRCVNNAFSVVDFLAISLGVILVPVKWHLWTSYKLSFLL